jgi:hypothetical protein
MEMLMTSPKRTIDLLDLLNVLGFDDQAFARLHHFRLKGRKPTISDHRHYCEAITSFQGDGENELVQRRLELVLNAYRAGGFESRRPEVFGALAEAAFYELPPHGNRMR